MQSSSNNTVTLQPPAARALQLLLRAGYGAYAVGGCVRDSLMGRPCSDWDLTTSASPADVLRVFAGFHTIETGIRHGTVTVIVDGMPLEITTFRTESTYTDGRHPDSVRFAARIEDDLSRRDFTVNAIAFSPESGLADPFHGLKDLEKRLIRCVGDPVTRFSEDGLRILRAVRFSAVLGFTVEKNTSDALYACADMLTHVSAERKAAELAKLLKGPYASDVLRVHAPLLRHIVPVSDDAAARIDRLPASLPLRMSALLWDETPEAAQSALETLRYDKKTIRTVRTLLEAAHAPLPESLGNLRRCVGRCGPLWEDVLTLAAADGKAVEALRQETAAIRARGDCVSLDTLAVNGQKLLRIGMKDREIGETLSYLLGAVMDGSLPNEEKPLLEEAAKHLKRKMES